MWTLLAHAGGWDEALMILAPLVVFGLYVTLRKPRSDEGDTGDDAEPEQADAPPASDPERGPGRDTDPPTA